MKGSEFLQEFDGRGQAAWEAAALDLARQGKLVQWPMVPIHLEADGHTGIIEVASDVLAVGTPDDFLRLPLTPTTAQAIFNLKGSLLPTPKLSALIAQQGDVKLTPQPIWPHNGPDLRDYAKHNEMIEKQRAGRTGLIVNGGKDVVISNIYKPGKVLIYGWFWPPGTVVPKGFSNPIQPRSNIHYDGYADYAHEEREVAPMMTVDGGEMPTEEVLKHPVFSKLLSDEGPLHFIRYPTPGTAGPQPYRPASIAEYKAIHNVYPRASTMSLTDLGIAALSEASAKKRLP